MPEPLKNLFTKELINDLSDRIISFYPHFEQNSFIDEVFNSTWKNLEFKERMRHITCSMKTFLPDNYKESIDILMQVSKDKSGLVYLSFPDFVELYGMDDFTVSVEALKFFTSACSSEFAVRPFILKYGDRMMDQMEIWTESDNEHIRRLASEGARPRLPWAMALPVFKKNPSRVLRILEKLQDDESEYVRKSVANNLNDISKDNPLDVIQIAQTWYGKTGNKDRLVKHALRTLLKKGDPDALKLFGFKPPNHISIDNFKLNNQILMGENLEFSFSIRSNKKPLGLLRLEFEINFAKARNKMSAKVFQISEGNVASTNKDIVKRFSFRKITTRKYYRGKHELSVIVNGIKKETRSFIVR